MQNIQFGREHRITEGPNAVDKTRNIVAKFVPSRIGKGSEKTGIWPNKKKSGFYIKEQYPPKVEERRRKLFQDCTQTLK